MTQDNHNELLTEIEGIKRFKESLVSEITATQSGALDEGDYKKGYERAKSDALLIILGTYAKMFESGSPEQETGALGHIREVMDSLIPENAAVGSRFLTRLKTDVSKHLGTYMWDAYMMGRNEGQYESEKTINKLKEDLKQANSNYKAICGLYGPAQQELSDLKASLRQLIKN